MNSSAAAPALVVVGSLNLDLVVRAPRLPQPGETLHGDSLDLVSGGKGANQAVAAARLGARTALVGRVGDDAFGVRLRDALSAAGVDIAPVEVTPQTTSGVALITVDAAGQNAIIVIGGANSWLTPDDVERQRARIAAADALLLQLEVPLPTVTRAARVARAAGVWTVLDPAPAPSCALPDELYEVDCFTPNQTEAETLTGRPVRSVAEAVQAAAILAERGARTVVIKLGELGAVWRDEGGRTGHVPAPSVNVVDTTAAGDAFTAALAYGVAAGVGLEEAVRWGCAAGALAVTKAGAQPALPTAAEVRDLLGRSP